MRILFSDLDGTLLDAHTYSPDAAREALSRLADIPVIFCSAKTRAEQLPIREDLGIFHPFIVENGSAIFDAEGQNPVVLGVQAAVIHEHLNEIRGALGIELTGFADMTVEGVAELTGLNLAGAERAKTREFSETIVTQLDPPQRERFQAACAQRGLKCPSGGRFMTITGTGADKGQAVTHLTSEYRKRTDQLETIAIGDSPNDTPMFAAVDRAFLVQRPEGHWHDIEVPTLYRLPAPGPLGFAQMVDTLLT